MLQIENLTKTYNKKFNAVKQFDLKINNGEIVALVGPNGSGKTTIINCLLGINSPTTGTVSLHGESTNTKKFYEKIGYVPDELLLPELLTANEYFDFLASMYEHASFEKREQLIKIFDMEPFIDNSIETYSHGMKKKTQIIGAFMLQSELIILDEPFRGLDIEAIVVLKKLINHFVRLGNSILIATHDLIAAEQMCDKVAVVSKGEKVADSTIKELLASTGSSNLEEAFLIVSKLKQRGKMYEEIINNM